MRRTFKYRAYPTPLQSEALHHQVNEACRLYNGALDERRSAWRMNGTSLGYYDQANQLKEIRAADAVGIANFSACQDVLRRVNKSFVAFFGRVKAGEKQVGFPRFRSRVRYDSLTWPSWGDGCSLRASGRLYLQGVGDLKLKWHRPLPAQSRIKTITAKREAGRWYVCFSIEMPEPEPLPACDLGVGIDVGLTTFAVLSDGTEIANPRHLRLAGEHVPKTLSERWHTCACGLSIGRDLNAALNMLRLALAPGLGWSLQARTVHRYSFGARHAVA